MGRRKTPGSDAVERKGANYSSASNQSFNLIDVEKRIRRDDHESMNLGVRDDHAVAWIVVKGRQLSGTYTDLQVERQDLKIVMFDDHFEPIGRGGQQFELSLSCI